MSFFSEVRVAGRRWRDRRAVAVTAVITLSLGIASTTGIFSVVYAVLLKPLPWRDAHELVSIYVARPHWRESAVLTSAWNTGNLSWPIYRDLQAKSRTLVEVAAWNRLRPALNAERNEMVYGMQVSAGFLPMLGVTPLLGRFFTDEEDESPHSVCVISYEAWQRRYGGSRSVLGQRVSLDETPHSIIGVLPAGFDFTGNNPPEFLIPWGNVPANNRHAGNHFMYGLARLRAGVPLADAVADADPLVRGTEKPEEKQARLVPLEDDQRGRSRGPLALLLAASTLLLLIACANVAGLLLAEGTSRRYEIAMRMALGGSRRTVVRQLLLESLVLAAAAIAAALVIVNWLTPLLAALAPAQLPRLDQVTVNLPVLAFGIVTGLTTAILFGIVPAISVTRGNPARWLQGSGRGAIPLRSRVHHLVVAGEVALAVLLVTGASLFGETLFRTTSQPLGFSADNLVVAGLRFPRDPSITREVRTARNEELAARLATLPGAEAATLASSAPFSGGYGSNGITILDKPGLKAEASRHVVSDTYFTTLEIPILKGRGFEPTDAPGDFVAVVTQEFERQFMDGDALGKRFKLNDYEHRVVGVVPATKHRRYTEDAGPAMYILNRQVPSWTTAHVIVRTKTDGRALVETIRKTIESADAQLSIVTIETMTEMVRRSVADERFRASLSIVFGATALLLSALGLYGLIARLVTDRRREIGVRLALGAQRVVVLRLVLRHAMQLVFGGVLIGVPAALGAATLVQSMLYGVGPTTPHTFAVVVTLLAAAGLVAAGVPALRAAKADVAAVLRAD